MNYFFLKKLGYWFLCFSFIYCSSTQVENNVPPQESSPGKVTREIPADLLGTLNRKLKEFEITGFRGDQMVSQPLYKKWASKWISLLQELRLQIPESNQLVVHGHADPHGGKVKTLRVAKGRADFIRSQLIKDLKLEPSQLTIQNNGSKYYKENKKRKSANRRVDFRIE